MKKRYLIPLVLLAAPLVNLAYAGITGDREKNLVKLSTCVAGFSPALATTGQWQTAYENVSWGPDFFPMHMWLVVLPGVTLGYTSGPYCPDSERAREVEQQLKGDPA